MVKLNEAHCNGMLHGMLGCDQHEMSLSTDSMNDCWAVLRHEKQMWLNVAFNPLDANPNSWSTMA